MTQSTHLKKNKANTAMGDKAKAYLNIHAHALFSSLGRLMQTPMTILMTIGVMAIAIALAAGFYLLVENAKQATDQLEATNQLSLFLKSELNDQDGERLLQTIKLNPDVKTVKLIRKQDAFEEFKTYSGFGEALNLLDENPLPTVIQVLPKNSLNDTQAIDNLIMSLSEFSQIDFVKLDMQWIKRLQSIMSVLQRSVFVISIMLSFAVLFIIGNTIRLELQNRKDEVIVSKLVGATHTFIQRPFLYTGFWLGFLAGILALLIVFFTLLSLQTPIEQVFSQYHSSLELKYLSSYETLIFLSISSALGVFGGWAVVCQQLQTIKPE